jgi:hypothetical protein
MRTLTESVLRMMMIEENHDDDDDCSVYCSLFEAYIQLNPPTLPGIHRAQDYEVASKETRSS